MEQELPPIIRCQSCGMPLDEGLYGTNADTTLSKEFCVYCFELGEYKEPKITIIDMVNRSVQEMTNTYEFPEQVARELALAVIPYLKRWKT
ncbi:transcriptional regulator [candidate division WWE3 bacterium]|nr:transcriptional regulator [candidate division WWE3 bacterium]